MLILCQKWQGIFFERTTLIPLKSGIQNAVPHP